MLPLYFGADADPTEAAGKRRVIAILQGHLAAADHRVAEMSRFRDEVAANIARLEGYLRDVEAEAAPAAATTAQPSTRR